MYLSKISEELGPALITPVVHKATKIAQAASVRQSIFDYDPEGKATNEYIEIAHKLALRILSDE